MSKLLNLNEMNGADKVLHKYLEIVANRFEKPVAAEFGVPYGGNVEDAARILKSSGGIVYGFDTFLGHPREVSYSDSAHEAWCMEHQYELYGKERITYEYQRGELDKMGYDNAILIKGLINDMSLKGNGIGKLHYAMLDLDFLNSMALAISITHPIISKGGFLCMHDCVPNGHIFGLWGLYQEVLSWETNGKKHFRLVEEVPQSYLVVLEKL